MSGRIDLATSSGPLVNIAAWFSLGVAVLATVAKIYTKMTMIKHLDWNDAAVIAALLSSVAMTVAIAKQVDSGLGQDKQTLSEAQVNQFYLTTYISSIFYVLAVFVVKLASLHFYLCLTQSVRALHVIRGLTVFIVLWVLAALFVQSFQCSLPNTWVLEGGKCIHESAFWTTNGVIDLLTQLPVSLLPLYLLYDINTNRTRKSLVMLSFTPNLLTIPFIILRIVFVGGLYSSPNDTRDSWTLFLISAVHANVAIFAATIPFSKPILDSLSVGVITNDIGLGLAWDQSNFRGKDRGSKYPVVRSGGSASKVFAGWRKSSNNGRFSSKRSENGSSAGLTDGNELTDRPRILRTVETTIETTQGSV